MLNPMVGLDSDKLYMPDAIHTIILHCSWMEGHMWIGTMTLLLGEDGLNALKNERICSGISILKTPTFVLQGGDECVVIFAHSENGKSRSDIHSCGLISS